MTDRSQVNLEQAHCIFCTDAGTSVLYDFTPFFVVQCLCCGSVYLNPRLERSHLLEVYSDADYYQGPGHSVGYDRS